MKFSDTEMKEPGLDILTLVILTFPKQIANPLVSADAKADRLTM